MSFILLRSFFFLNKYMPRYIDQKTAVTVINVRCAQVNGVYPLCGIYSKVLII